jgi:hypothetical protein
VSTLSIVSYVVPLAAAAGLNLYATVAVLGLCARYDLFALPAQFTAFEHPAVIITALALFLIEFVADKVPWVDSVWDVLHTVIRPAGGALIALTAVGEATPVVETLMALLGGSVALTTHFGKAGTRLAANASPEPFSNWALSLVEDLFAVGLTWFAIEHPYIALLVTIVLLATIVAFATVIIRLIRNKFRSSSIRRTITPRASA